MEAGAGSSPSTTTTTPEPVPSLDGTYQVTITLTSKTGDVTAWPEVGAVETESWEVTGTCSYGLCGATVTSSTDGSFTLTYAGESWTQDTSYVAECVDTVTRVPTGDKVDVFGSRTLSATGPTTADPRDVADQPDGHRITVRARTWLWVCRSRGDVQHRNDPDRRLTSGHARPARPDPLPLLQQQGGQPLTADHQSECAHR